MNMRLTVGGFHVHAALFVEAVDPANEGDWLPHEVHDVLNPDERMRFSMNCLDFLPGHFLLLNLISYLRRSF